MRGGAPSRSIKCQMCTKEQGWECCGTACRLEVEKVQNMPMCAASNTQLPLSKGRRFNWPFNAGEAANSALQAGRWSQPSQELQITT
jgi:hypothetical protein